jgi:hypothetical protein
MSSMDEVRSQILKESAAMEPDQKNLYLAELAMAKNITALKKILMSMKDMN